MTNNEEIERKMNFIVEQQAQFAADIQQLQESQVRTEQVVAQTAEAVAQSARNCGPVGGNCGPVSGNCGPSGRGSHAPR